jgi:uncharacterized membrane protein YjjP (DUF1212 family)
MAAPKEVPMETPKVEEGGSGDSHRFLIRTAELLHRFGTPAHRLERVMGFLSQRMGVSGVFLSTPTALMISLGEGLSSTTHLRRIEAGSVDVDKLIRFDEVLDAMSHREVAPVEALRRLEEIAESRPPFSLAATTLAVGMACGIVAVLFAGTPLECCLAGCLGMAVFGIEWWLGRSNTEQGLLYPLAGFVAALGSLAFAHWVTPIDDRIVTLAALIVLVPGFPLTIALTELAMGHLSSGVARLAGALATMVTLLLGVAIAWRVAGGWRELPAGGWRFPESAAWIAGAAAPVFFAIVFRARLPQWPVIIAVSLAGFSVSRLLSPSMGAEVGSFLGALAVGCGSNLYARMRDRPAMVPLTPGMIILVPGTLGYRSLAALLDQQTVQGIDIAFDTLIVGMSLVGGLLASNALLPPRRML